MATRTRPPGQCTKCGNVYPETDEYFHPLRRRGRVELRSVCKACISKYDHEYGKRNADAISAYNKARAQTPHHREIMRAAWRRYRAKPEYKEIDREQYRRTVSTPEGREKIRTKCRRRRARIRGSTKHHTAQDVMVALEVQGNLCFYCQVDIADKYTVDHLTPLIRGGSDGPENIVIACPNCNFRKSDKTPQEFADGIKHERKQYAISRRR